MVAAGIVVLNRILSPRFVRLTLVFHAMQLVNLGAAAWFALRGFDGLPAFPIAGWAVAVLYLLHFGRNLAARRAALRA